MRLRGSSIRTAIGRVSRQVLRPVAETLFPPNCWLTHRPTTWHEGGLSLSVRASIAAALARPYCGRCGATQGPWSFSYTGCQRCSHRNLGTVAVARAGTLEPPFSSLLYRLKFGRHWQIAPLLAIPLWQALQRQMTQCDLALDAIIPIPLHWMRNFTRGFNQAEELGWQLSRLSGVPMHRALCRIRQTTPQTRTSSVSARRDNLRGAFMVRRGYGFQGATVWLIDDICTTGATLHAAASALARLPAHERPAQICAAVVAVTDHTPPPLT